MIWALHGFLGQADDWKFYQERIPQWHSVDLWETLQMNEEDHFWVWAERFNQMVIESGDNAPQILGYSLGGRLALHAILQNPGLWKAATIVSTHPGLQNQLEKEQRILNDQKWQQKFLSEEWEVVLDDWNAQGVLQTDELMMPRKEKDFERKKLAQSLEVWSLGKQEDLREKLAGLKIPLTWVTGEKDQKFCRLANQVKEVNENFDTKVIKKAGHRCPWSAVDQFERAISL